MNIRRFLILIFLAFGFSPRIVASSEHDDIRKKQSQLETLRKEIDKYEKQITEKEKKEKATLDLLDNYDHQASLLRKLISQLHNEEIALQRDINSTRQSIGELTGQLAFLKKHYANYVTTVYKYGRTYDLELLLSSKSFNQMLVRSEYLKRFSNQRKKDLDRIDDRRSNLEEQNATLQKQLAEQRAILADKQKEENKLSTKMKKRKQLLVQIRKDKKNYKHELDRKKQDVKELEQLIAKLIEEEVAKKNRKEPEREPIVGGAFQAKRGRMRWPVSGGKLTAHFGNQEHPTLHTVTQNTGIDITVPIGTRVEAVADGEVSKIHWLPSFGNLIILSHSGGFRTVYAHLSEISVDEGAKVHEGDALGQSGESLSGSVLHFEIYKEREKLDPEQWLKPKSLSHR
jgi:septal ring factor EnvC (AmiA/AmiB activator)